MNVLLVSESKARARLTMMFLCGLFLAASTVALCAIGNSVTARCAHQNSFIQLGKMPTVRYGYKGCQLQTLLSSELMTDRSGWSSSLSSARGTLPCVSKAA